jgi:hypothetical protein
LFGTVGQGRWTRAYTIDMMITQDNHKKKRHNDYKRTNDSCIGIERNDAYKTLTMITLPMIGDAEQLVLMRRGNLR